MELLFVQGASQARRLPAESQNITEGQVLKRFSTPWMTWNSSSFRGAPKPVDSLQKVKT
jgi:hypothetical protein